NPWTGLPLTIFTVLNNPVDHRITPRGVRRTGQRRGGWHAVSEPTRRTCGSSIVALPGSLCGTARLPAALWFETAPSGCRSRAFAQITVGPQFDRRNRSRPPEIAIVRHLCLRNGPVQGGRL